MTPLDCVRGLGLAPGSLLRSLAKQGRMHLRVGFIGLATVATDHTGALTEIVHLMDDGSLDTETFIF